MTTNANAPVETRHLNETKARFIKPGDQIAYEQRFAQSLANNEALNNRLAEIEQFARDAGIDLSGHTPSPCPGCAAKDEAMAEIAAVCSDPKMDFAWQVDRIETIASRFISPPADPVAEALKAAIHAYWPTREWSDIGFEDALAELKKRLPLGGAK